jgi:hypothetical protein
MFAILIAHDNMPKIEEHLNDENPTIPWMITELNANSNRDWYFVTGYVKRSGEFINWTILPAYVVENNFEYDPDKINTDWDQIVRK